MASSEKIGFEQKSIGEVLSQNTLEVPLNQREYSWEKEHVQELFQDYIAAMNTKQGVHFLGTIVLTKGANNTPEVSDGQQRLATTTILLAAIRDHFARVEGAEGERTKLIERDYLITTDRRTTEKKSKLKLNVDDHEFFTKYVLLNPKDASRISKTGTQIKSASHKK